MRVRLVESAFGQSAPTQYATAFIVNDSLAVDAGPLGFWRTPDDQARIRHVLLTHTHVDHLATLGIFVENAYRPGRECLTVWGSESVRTCLREDIFNGRVWPNLLELPTREAPMLKLAALEAEESITLDGIRITPVPVSHTVPTFGLVLEERDTAVVIVSDTGPTERIWEVANALPHLKAVYLEATFPNDMVELADISRHLMPSTFGIELRKLHRSAAVLAVHLKARYRDRVESELAALGLDGVSVAEPGREYHLVSRPGCVLSWTVNGQAVTAELADGETILGRAPETCTVVIDNERVSRRHAMMHPSGDAWTITDLGAANGTFVNGERLPRDEPHTLADGDTIRLGAVELTCRLVAGPSPPIVFDQEEIKGGTSILRLDDVRALIGGEAWIADLFNEAAEGLLASSGLDAMLDTVLALVFKHLPAQRGSVCMFDRDTTALVHKASRTARGITEEPLRLSQTIVDAAVRDRKAFLYRRGLPDNPESMSIVALEIRSAMCAPLVSGDKVVGLLYADTKNLILPFDDQHLKVFSTLAKLSAVAVEEARLRDEIVREHAIREGLSRYSGKAVVDRIMASTGGQMIVDEAEVSVLFADLVGFTSLAEDLTASEVTRVLNGVFDHLTRAVFEWEGTLDKFIGDELMAFFGAPLPQPDHAMRAVRAALRLQEKLRDYNAAHPDQKPLEMRIGINSGSVVVGDIGSFERKDYTVIGDTVNTAKRIESTAAGPGDIVIGASTYQAVSACFTCEPLAPIELKGKRGVVQTYRVIRESVEPGVAGQVRS